jgi:hypothetical protein
MFTLLVTAGIAIVVFFVLLGLGMARVSRMDDDATEREHFNLAAMRGFIERRFSRDRRRTRMAVEVDRRTGADRRDIVERAPLEAAPDAPPARPAGWSADL